MKTLLSILFMAGITGLHNPGNEAKGRTGGNGLTVGSEVPEFTLPDQNGKTFDLKDVLGKENLVIYFYVRDNTPGCTKEACTFRDDYTRFRNDNALVIGISGQSVESHKAFADENKLPFILLSDTGNKVRDLFGVKNEMGSIPGRETFVINKEGKVVYIFNSISKPVEHVTEALRILDGMS